jgi:hypothetical protein
MGSTERQDGCFISVTRTGASDDVPCGLCAGLLTPPACAADEIVWLHFGQVARTGGFALALPLFGGAVEMSTLVPTFNKAGAHPARRIFQNMSSEMR